MPSPYRRQSRVLMLVAGLAAAHLCAAAAAHAERTEPYAKAASVRAAAPVLLVDDAASSAADAWYEAFMDGMFGVGTWDEYEFATDGVPDPPELFLATIAQYQCVLWYADTSDNIIDLAQQVDDYLDPATPGVPAGRLILVSGYPLLGTQLSTAMGIATVLAPGRLTIEAGRKALGFGLEATDLVAQWAVTTGWGLQPLAGAEIITRMEYCGRCYATRPPYDPVVGVRRPDEHDPSFARTAIFGIPLHTFANADVSLRDFMKWQMGIIPVSEQASGADHIRLAINSAGYVGSFFASPDRPSLVYPYPSHVENLYHAGLWIGARRPDGTVGVSTSADQYGHISEGEMLREFAPTDEPMRVTSNVVGSDLYDPAAKAPWQVECSFHDRITVPESGHTPLGLTVSLRAMSWNSAPYDDAVVLEYSIVNDSGAALSDVYVGFYEDTTVGNTTVTSPYAPPGPGVLLWNWYDDVNGAWRPGDFESDPELWMMWEHDADGDGGAATGWIGCRFLGSDPPAVPVGGVPPVSYNAEVFRQFPETDDAVVDTVNGGMVPGRYQMLANGDFDVGVTPDQDFTVASDWAGLLATGPFPELAAGDTLQVTFAMVGGADAYGLWRNGRHIFELAAAGYEFDPVAGEGETALPDRLGDAQPNPFNALTSIRFQLESPGDVRLTVHDLRGRHIATLVTGHREAGPHVVAWDGRDGSGRILAAGVYLYRLSTDGYSETKRMVLVK